MIDKTTLQYIFKAIRSCFTWSDSYSSYFTKGRTNKCEICNKMFIKSEMELDHEPPVVPLDKFWYQLSIDEYYDRVFNGKVRKLCKACHKTHTKQQTKDRKKAKKVKK